MGKTRRTGGGKKKWLKGRSSKKKGGRKGGIWVSKKNSEGVEDRGEGSRGKKIEIKGRGEALEEHVWFPKGIEKSDLEAERGGQKTEGGWGGKTGKNQEFVGNSKDKLYFR